VVDGALREQDRVTTVGLQSGGGGDTFTVTCRRACKTLTQILCLSGV